MLNLKFKTESIWTYILLERERFTNKYYCPEHTKGVIDQIPITSHFCLKEWRELYYKWSPRGYDSYNPNMTR